MLGWDQGAFTNRLLTKLADTGIAIDEEIPRPEYRSTSHQVYWMGDIESIDLKESSGLAASTRREGLLWSINDSGSEPAIFGLSERGAHLGKWIVAGVESNDWEGMDSFKTEDKHYLLIGDTGDNFRSRKEVSFLVIEEPVLDEDVREVTVSWQTKFSFPEGPRDVEAVAVDLQGPVP